MCERFCVCESTPSETIPAHSVNDLPPCSLLRIRSNASEWRDAYTHTHTQARGDRRREQSVDEKEGVSVGKERATD